MAIVAGFGNVLIGIVLFYQGWSQVTINVWRTFASVVMFSLLVNGGVAVAAGGLGGLARTSAGPYQRGVRLS